MLKEAAQKLTSETVNKQRYEDTIAGKWEKQILHRANQGLNYDWSQIGRDGKSNWSDEDVTYLTSQGFTVGVESMSLFDSEIDDMVACACHVVRW